MANETSTSSFSWENVFNSGISALGSVFTAKYTEPETNVINQNSGMSDNTTKYLIFGSIGLASLVLVLALSRRR